MSRLASLRRRDEELELLASDYYVDPESALVSPGVSWAPKASSSRGIVG